MPNPATMKLYHEELQAMVLAVDSELPALHESVETLKSKVRKNKLQKLAYHPSCTCKWAPTQWR